MATTYNLSSTDSRIKKISRVRLQIPDREAPFFFQDDELLVFLEDNADNAKLAAADALESRATDEAFVQKVQTTLGVSSDGAKTADFVLKRAQALREQAKAAASIAATGYDNEAGSASIAPYA